jgi:hypothetical protein
VDVSGSPNAIGGERKIHTSTTGRGVKDVRICLEVDKHPEGP